MTKAEKKGTQNISFIKKVTEAEKQKETEKNSLITNVRKAAKKENKENMKD